MLNIGEKPTPTEENVLSNTTDVDQIFLSEQQDIETFKAAQVSMLCLQCSNYVNLKDLQDHRTLHEALSLYQYDFKTKPISEQALSHQRAVLVRDLNKLLNISRSTYQRKLGEVDLAYEVIKSDMYGRSNRVKPSFIENHDVIIKSVKVKLNERIALGICESTNEKWRSVMEDTHSYVCKCTGSQTVLYFAVFDGYGGPTAARKCADQFYQILNETFEEFNFNECIKGKDCSQSTAFQQAFEEMDKVLLLGAEEKSRNRWSGCSATICILTNDTLHVANVGNVKAVLIREDDSLQTLTEDHCPANKREKHRIKASGDICRWSKTAWVNGVAMTTRGLGNHGDPVLKSNIINIPAVCCMSPTVDCQIILVASCGLWQVFDESELIIIIQEWLKAKASGLGLTTNENSDEHNCGYSGKAIELLVENEDALNTESTKTNNQIGEGKVLPNKDLYVLKTGNNQNFTNSKKNHCFKCSNVKSFNATCCCDNSQKGLPANTTDMNHHIYETASTTKSTEQRNYDKQSVLGLLKKLLEMHDRDVLALEISKHLIEAALTGGAKDNITVLVVIPCNTITEENDEFR